MKETLEVVLSRSLRPICPRDNHRMKYEAKGIQWKTASDDQIQTMASYHCNFEGCSVRYDHMNGYFTIVNAPERPFLVEEPGANPLQCAKHATWLYRCEDDKSGSGFAWQCGVEGCEYARTDVDELQLGRAAQRGGEDEDEHAQKGL
jgi:hypothetical protein